MSAGVLAALRREPHVRYRTLGETHPLKAGIAHAREALLFLVGRKSGHVIDRAGLEFDELIASLRGQGRLPQYVRERRLVDTDDELVGAERFAIEERARLEFQMSVELKMLGALDELGDSQPQGLQKSRGNRATRRPCRWQCRSRSPGGNGLVQDPDVISRFILLLYDFIIVI